VILKRYLNREVVAAASAVLVVLLLLFVSGRFVKYIELAVEGSISSGAVFELLALQIPAVVGFLLPMAFFIGILLTLGKLYAQHELTIFYAVGLSEGDIAKLMLPVAVIFAVLSLILSMWLTPWAKQNVQRVLAAEKAQAKLGIFSPGKFQENADETGVVYVEAKDKEKIYRLFAMNTPKGQPEKLELQTANSGYRWTDEETGQEYLILEDGELLSFDPGQKRWTRTSFERYFMRLSPPSNKMDEDEVSVRTLNELIANGQRADWAELHWRLAAPISILILCFMSVPLSRTEPRKGRYAKLFPAIMSYMLYALVMLNSRKLLESGRIPIEYGMWWIHASALFVTVWLYSRGRPRRRRAESAHA